MTTTNLYVREGGDGSDTFVEAKDSDILSAGFAICVNQYQLCCSSKSSGGQTSDEAQSVTEEIIPENCPKQSSSMKSASTDDEDQVEEYLTATGSASASSSEECIDLAPEGAPQSRRGMRESGRAFYAAQEDLVNSSNPVTPATSDNIFGRGTSECPKPKKKCQKSAKGGPKFIAAKRSPRKIPALSKCEEADNC